MNLDTSAETQHLQSMIKAAELDSFLHVEFTRSEKNGLIDLPPHTPHHLLKVS
jgi:hypothetical protein